VTDRYEHVREYYGDFADEGAPSRRVAWRCYDDQVMRFEVLLDAIDPVDFPCSVLDVGSGNGALFAYLKRTNRLGEYTGVDLLDHMVDEARRNHPDGDFVHADLLHWDSEQRFDLVVCSGSLNVRVPRHPKWVQQMLAAMWKRARWAVAVNFQTTRAFRYNPVSKYDSDLFHGQRATLFDWCEKLTPWISMRQDYLGDDCAFHLYKDYNRTTRRMTRMLESDPRDPSAAAAGLAFLLLERKMPAAALQVLADVPETAEVLNFRGLAHHKLGDGAEASALYRRALELDPKCEAARLNLDWVSKSPK